MPVHHYPDQAPGLTLAAEVDALGFGQFGIMHEAQAIGQVSGRELLTFRDAITARMRQQRAGDPEEMFVPNPDLNRVARQRLQTAHMVGSTVADLLLSKEATDRMRGQL
jgi:hypothetical protein